MNELGTIPAPIRSLSGQGNDRGAFSGLLTGGRTRPCRYPADHYPSLRTALSSLSVARGWATVPSP